MKKVLYFDIQFHVKTNSSHFLYELLEEYFEVDKCFVSLNYKEDEILKAYNNKYYDYLLLYQIMPERRIIEKFSYGTGLLFPMYDGVLNKTLVEWNEYKDFLIINFSKTLHNYLIKNGFCSRYIQYFPKPIKIKNWGDIDKMFFWQRTNQIHINQVLSLCGELNIKKIHIHKALDPDSYYIPVSRRFPYDFSYSKWFNDKSDLLDIIFESSYYSAPRKYEGIGMSFLDAMAMGRCVIAPNYPTMNEYISDRVNGLLYDYENPQAIDECDVRGLQRTAYQFINEGYEKWTLEKYHIIDWIEETEFQNKSIQIEFHVDDNKIDVLQDKKYHSYYMLMNKWMMLKNRKMILAAWFKSKSVFRIALYGYSEMAARVAEELEMSLINVECYIDKENKWTEDGRYTVTLDQFVPSVDMIVVTAYYYFDEIKNMITEMCDVEVVSLEKIIEDLIMEL